MAVTRSELLQDVFPDHGRRWLQISLTALFSVVLLGGVYVYRFRLSGSPPSFGGSPAAAAMAQPPVTAPVYAARKHTSARRHTSPTQVNPGDLSLGSTSTPQVAEPTGDPVSTKRSDVQETALAVPSPSGAGGTNHVTTASGPPPDESPKQDQPPPFSLSEALGALTLAASAASSCLPDAKQGTKARVAVSFMPNGEAAAASLEDSPYAGTPIGECVARRLRSTRIGPFRGTPVTVRKTLQIK